MNELRYCFNKFINIYKSKNKKEIINVTKELLILILILSIFKLPFVFFRDITVDYFIKMNVKNILDSIFYWLFEILYILFFILMLRNWLLRKYNANHDK